MKGELDKQVLWLELISKYMMVPYVEVKIE